MKALLVTESALSDFAKPPLHGQIAVFPLSALTDENEVHVVYDRSATIGRNAAGGVTCDDCNAGFNLSGVR